MHTKQYVVQFQQHSPPEGRERVARALRLLLTRRMGPLAESIDMISPGDQINVEKGGVIMAPEEGVPT